MPVVRLSRRRRSSLALNALSQVKAGYYGVHSPSPRQVTFAPNVTPGTFIEPDPSSTSDTGSPTASLFPPSELPAPPPSRRRLPPGKRRSLGYIPRPPNAFMLFRADFVRQKHVPGSIETNHGSLSKIIGNCWRALPLEEKRVWEVKAKHAKAEHKARYPEYRFRPVHNKKKDKKKDKPLVTAEDERRCEEVAQLLLEGKKGDELAAAVRDLDRSRESMSPSPVASTPLLLDDQLLLPPSLSHAPQHALYRRSSSVPLLNDFQPIALPSVPFFGSAREGNATDDDLGIMPRFGSLSRASRIWLGQRRASSCQPIGMRGWPTNMMSHPLHVHHSHHSAVLERDTEPLPEPNTSLFDPNFLASSSFGFLTSSSSLPSSQGSSSSNGHGFFSTLATPGHDLSHAISPLENPSLLDDASNAAAAAAAAVAGYDAFNWLPMPHHHQPQELQQHTHDTHLHLQQQHDPLSQPSSAYSSSPTLSDEMVLPMHAPQPLHPSASGAPAAMASFDMWKDNHHQHAMMDPFGAGGLASEHHALGAEGDVYAPLFEVSYLDAAAAHQQQQHQQTHSQSEPLPSVLSPIVGPVPVPGAVGVHPYSMSTTLGFALDDMVHDGY